jgi:hypothetical protein
MGLADYMGLSIRIRWSLESLGVNANTHEYLC